MARDDNQLLDNALAAAEEKLSSRSSVEGDEKEPETDEEEAAPENEGVESDDDQESDQEASTEADESAPEPPVSQEAATQGAQSDDVTAPVHWSAEKKALFSSASPELKRAIAEDVLRTQQAMSRLGNQAQRAKAWEERVNSDFESEDSLIRHRNEMRAQGIRDEVEELHRYRAWNSVFKTDPLSGVRELILRHGITPNELAGGMQEATDEGYQDPRVETLQQQIEDMQRAQEERTQAEEEQRLASRVNEWKAQRDRYGKPRAEFSKLYAPQIDAEWRNVLQEYAHLGQEVALEDTLTEALNRVQDRVYAAHGIKPSAPQPVTSREQIIANSKKAQAAVTKATGAPRSDVITQKPKKKYKNDKDWVDAAMKRAEERRGASR